MSSLLSALLYIHVTAGFIGLALFWIPAFTKKGGETHKKIGKLYVAVMWVMVISAVLLCVKNLLVGNTVTGLFLGFIALITANPLWYGMGVLKHKQGLSLAFLRTHAIVRSMVVLAALGMLCYGLFVIPDNQSVVLLYIFGGLGVLDVPQLIKDIKSPPTNRSWFKDHMVSMFTSGIAAFTAFLVFGASNFLSSILDGYWGVIPWILPTIIGTFAIVRSIRYWTAKGAIPKASEE